MEATPITEDSKSENEDVNMTPDQNGETQEDASPKADSKPKENEEKEKTDNNSQSPKGKKRKIGESDSKEAQESESSNTTMEDLNMPPKQTLGKGKRARIPNKRYSEILLSPQSRTPKSTVENGDKLKSDSEMELLTLKPEEGPSLSNLKARSNTSSPAGTKRGKVVDLTNPNFQKPFLFGWRREVVSRGTNAHADKINRDIYYYNPAGKKVRSMREVAEVLVKDKNLTIENFTFFKEALGINDPEKEIVRDAGKPNRKSASATPKILSPKVQSPKISIPKAPSPKVTSPKAATRSGLGNIKVKLTPNKAKPDKKLKAEPEDSPRESRPVKKTPAKKPTAAKSPAQNLQMESKPCQPCSIRCLGVLGMVPTLQCRICLCLYHYECVGLSPHVQIQAYVCKNCHLEHGQSIGETPSIILPPLTPLNTLKSLKSQGSTFPTLQRIPREADSPPSGVNLEDNNDNNDKIQEAPQPTENKNLLGSVTSWLPHSSTIHVDSRNKENEPLRTPRPQYVEYLGGRKFLIIPKHNVVSVSPTGGANLKQSNLRSMSGENMEVVGEKEDDGGGGGEVIPESDTEPIETSTRPKRRPGRFSSAANSVSPPQKQQKKQREESTKNADSYLQNLSYGYSTLLYVFQYLKVQDLLRAGCVCTMWRDIASHPSLWKTVRMKNSQVHSFEGLADTLKKHGTVHLDLRKMLLPTVNGSEDIWPEFSQAIHKVQTLRKIELCRCPASVVEQLAVTNQDLEVINAVTIKSENMTLDPLSSLKNLKELRLKSTNGLNFTSDIVALKELTNLTHLSLTSIKDLNKLDLSVISDLTNLESLDLGECTDFPSSFGEEILIKLTKLEKLRLEKGQGTCHIFEILNAVQQMAQLEQLELVNFDIKAGFDVALGQCSNIRKLLIIPTYISQSATTNHMVLGGVLRLQDTLSHFVWGVTLELLRVTELFVDQCEDPDKRDKKDKKSVGNGDSIPVLKPVPLITDKQDEILPAHDPPQVEILPLPHLQKLLLQSLPTTRVKILKIPFHATWRQSITDTVN